MEDGRGESRPHARMSSGFSQKGQTGKRRICFPMTSRAYYGRSQLLLKKLHDHPDLELELMLGGSILLDKYSRHIAEDIEAGGFTDIGVAVQRHRGRQPRGDGENRVPDGARVHQRPAHARSRHRRHQWRPVRAARDCHGGGVPEQDDRSHRGRRRQRQHRRKRAARHHQACAHPFRDQRRCAPPRARHG